MRNIFKRRRPKHVADNRPSVAEARVMSAWGMNQEQWAALSDWHRAECRRNITAGPWFRA